MNLKIGDLVTVKNAKKYDVFAPKEVQGTIYILWDDDNIGVATIGGGSMKVKRCDIRKRRMKK